MKTNRNIAIILLTSLALSCGWGWSRHQSRNRDNLMRLELGMSKEQVIQVMGKPDLNEAYQKPGGGDLEILFYYTNRKWADANVTRDECTPIIFESGKLTGWGEEFYQTKVKVELEIKNK